jgi:transcriptional regulator with XRE-family HTH domain
MNQKQDTFKSVGENIRALRIRSGLSLKEAANRLGISTSSLSKIETGITDVNLSRLEQIADIYSVKLVQLWEPDFKSHGPLDPTLMSAKKKVFDLESEISVFQRKVILLYEKLREQANDHKSLRV